MNNRQFPVEDYAMRHTQTLPPCSNHPTNMHDLYIARTNLQHLIFWMEKDGSLDACNSRLKFLKSELLSAERRIRTLQNLIPRRRKQVLRIS